jgi:hypothetical protein
VRSLKAVRSRVAVSVWSSAELRFFGISGWVRAYWTDAGKPNECGRRVGRTWQPLLDGRWLVALLCRGWCIWPVQRCHPRSISILHFIAFLNTHHVDSALVLNPCFLLWSLFSLGVRSLNTVFFSFFSFWLHKHCSSVIMINSTYNGLLDHVPNCIDLVTVEYGNWHADS